MADNNTMREIDDEHRHLREKAGSAALGAATAGIKTAEALKVRDSMPLARTVDSMELEIAGTRQKLLQIEKQQDALTKEAGQLKQQQVMMEQTGAGKEALAANERKLAENQSKLLKNKNDLVEGKKFLKQQESNLQKVLDANEPKIKNKRIWNKAKKEVEKERVNKKKAAGIQQRNIRDKTGIRKNEARSSRYEELTGKKLGKPSGTGQESAYQFKASGQQVKSRSNLDALRGKQGAAAKNTAKEAQKAAVKRRQMQGIIQAHKATAATAGTVTKAATTTAGTVKAVSATAATAAAPEVLLAVVLIGAIVLLTAICFAFIKNAWDKNSMSGGVSGSQAYLEWMAKTAADDQYVYSWGAGHNAEGKADYGTGRDGHYYGYDCSGFVYCALKNNGFDIGPFDTNSEDAALTGAGFERHAYTSMSDLQPGDILHTATHTETYYGNGQIVGAHNTVAAKGASASISIEPFYEGGWDYYYRCTTMHGGSGSTGSISSIQELTEAVKAVHQLGQTSGWIYGDSHATPPSADGISSCDRLVSRALYDLGYTDQRAGGETIYTLDSYLTSHGFTKSTDYRDIREGSIMLVGRKETNEVQHAFYVVSYDPNTGTGTKYDHGSNGAIRSNQPMGFSGTTDNTWGHGYRDIFGIYNLNGGIYSLSEDVDNWEWFDSVDATIDDYGSDKTYHFGPYTAELPLSDDVWELTPLIVKYADEMGMTQYVPLIQAIMMQESGGHYRQYPDVMQCSESLNWAPNTIASAEFSIRQGIKILKGHLEAAGAQGPGDIDNIKLAIQAYNYGGAYIPYARAHGGGYSDENARSFSRMMAAKLGWRSYGCPGYPNYALRYYSYSGTDSTASSAGTSYPSNGMEIPLYDQKKYSGVSYGDSNIANCGCGPTAFAMVASYLKGTTITPPDAVSWCGNRYYVSGQGTSWGYFASAASHFGMGNVVQTSDRNSVLKALSEGHPVISSQKPGLFTRGGHFIVLRGTSGGRILVNDPNDSSSKNYINRSFDFNSEIDRTSASYWIFY